MRIARIKNAALATGVVAVLAACGSPPNANTAVDLKSLRSSAKGSADGEKTGRWLLDEMLAPGGTSKNADDARAQLERAKDKGLYASIAGGLYDETHGEPRKAAQQYVAALGFAKKSDDPTAPLAAWFASHHLVSLRGSVANLWEQNRTTLLPIIEAPGHVGWRSLAELHEWSTAEALDKAEVTGDAYDALVTSRMGCARKMRIAGPFGRGTAAERRRSFPAERAPWPPSWEEEPQRGTVPHILKTERHRCMTASTEKTEDGVFYVETFFESPAERDLLVAVQGSVAVWVDDVLIGERDLRQWGVWQRFGSAVRVGKGRHRVVSRVMADVGSIRLLNLDGTAASIETDDDARKPYGLSRPAILANPNPVDELITKIAEEKDPGTTPLVTALAAHAAAVDGLNDVATVMIQPLITPKDAAPIAILMAAQYARADVAFPEQARRSNEKELYVRAAAADPRLWYARAWLVLDDAEQRGLVEGVEPLKKIASEVPGVPEVTEQLARVYGKLGWRAERMRTVQDLAQRFPDDRDAIALYVSSLEEDGALAEADKVAERLKKLDADSEVDLDRAIARRDWKAAIAELRRLEKRRPDRKEIAGRIADVLARSGDPSAAAAQLQKALAKNPADAPARLRIADYSYAKGDTMALRRALAEALQAGSKGLEIREAVELIEGASLLEPYRTDGRKVIKEFEAWERGEGSAGSAGDRKPRHMEGTAARVFDYAATWVHPDGSSEMLEHEILRM
ncbi:MAG: Cell division protein FtsK, partial [Myxococcaceae bacterium]|nr:Cell division protein FtsK [Myxococcaceae bacterium]